MSYRVEVKRSAEKELAQLPVTVQQRMAKALLGLEQNPFPPRSKKLRGSEGFRIRVGDYRILYTVQSAASEVFVYAIGHRREVYR